MIDKNIIGEKWVILSPDEFSNKMCDFRFVRLGIYEGIIGKTLYLSADTPTLDLMYLDTIKKVCKLLGVPRIL